VSARHRTLLGHAEKVVRACDVECAATDRLPRALAVDALAALVPGEVAWLQQVGPPAMRASFEDAGTDHGPDWMARFARAIAPGPGEASPPDSDGIREFVCDLIVQPFAEVVAATWAQEPSSAPAHAHGGQAPATCPCCSGLPVLGVLRERGHGAGRALICGRCVTEWAAPRLVCPSCGAVDVQALPVFRADTWPAARIDGCDRCQTYVKSFDLTVDGSAVPLVDDIATLPLDLWAAEQGLRRLHPHLLRF
jgi:Protein involved in formate dehydrogenase formation